jgi:hypothetical protein
MKIAILAMTLLTPVQWGSSDPSGTLRRMDEQARWNSLQNQLLQDRMQRTREFEQQQMHQRWLEGQMMQQRLREQQQR